MPANRLQAVHQATLKGTMLQKLGREAFAAAMVQRLAKKPWIAEKREQLPMHTLAWI
jgi:glucuronate isomerase